MTCMKGMTKDTCPYNPRLGCDCGQNPPSGPDPLVDRDCAVLDGKCDCPNTGGSVPDTCKYLTSEKINSTEFPRSKKLEELEGKCLALWTQAGFCRDDTGTPCNCEIIQGNYSCKLNPF